MFSQKIKKTFFNFKFKGGEIMGKLLSQKQINEYERDGFICPIDVLSEEELLTCNLGIEKFERDSGEEIDFPYKSRCHQIFCWADQ